ncbi:MAG: carbohydrate ABC transporter permease [Oscillospiraceae bacterium]|nr:carbohydrate ABC transporter permease [Oscillospiraceae bacterium]MBQ9982042.1 carbohydrate ABC transporter permease [Oscillospiraceae bacterium]
MMKTVSVKKQKRRQKVANVFLTIFAILCAVLFLFPTVMTIANSFMTQKEINANYGAMISNFDESEGKKTYISEKLNLKLIPDKVSVEQYKTVLLKSSDYLMKFWNSVILVVPIVLFQIIVACLAAYSFARYRGKLKELLFFLYVILMLMPYQVTLVPNYLVADTLGLLDTRMSIILPGIFAPFSVFLLAKVMRRIPTSFIEAAKLDGAGEVQIFTQICLPLSKSAIFSVVLLLFIDYWNMVEQPLIMLSDSDYHPLSVFLSKINSGDVGLAFAVAVIYMIPTLLMFFYGEDYLVEGIAYSGGIKG